MEGPSLIILRKELSAFKGMTINAVEGNTRINKNLFLNQTIRNFKTWGKHFLIVFKKFSIRIHFLMFGSYRINQRKEGAVPRLSLQFSDGSEINFYTCSIQILDGSVNDHYDWSTDVMSTKWDPKRAHKKLKGLPTLNVGDALLDQQIFSGVGNIIKNEVLFRIKVHPESIIGGLPSRKLGDLIREARAYSFDFLKWKKKYELKKHWLIYTKKKCPRCHLQVRKKYTGKTKRRSFFCENCQRFFD